MTDIKRRIVLKGISVTSAAALAPLSLQAAATIKTEQYIAMHIDARHGRFQNSTSNEIINTGNKPIVLNTQEPVGYKNSNGRFVSLYINSPDETKTLNPGERLPVFAGRTMITPLDTLAMQNKLVANAISNA